MGIGRGWRKRWRRVWGGRTRGLGRRVASRARGLMGVGWVLVVVDTAVLSSLEASTWTSSHSSLRDMHGTHPALLYRADARGHIQEGSGRATRSGRVLDCRARDLPCSPLCLLSHDLTPVSGSAWLRSGTFANRNNQLEVPDLYSSDYCPERGCRRPFALSPQRWWDNIYPTFLSV